MGKIYRSISRFTKLKFPCVENQQYRPSTISQILYFSSLKIFSSSYIISV